MDEQNCSTCRHSIDLIEGSICCIPDENHVFHEVLRCMKHSCEEKATVLTRSTNVCNAYESKER